MPDLYILLWIHVRFSSAKKHVIFNQWYRSYATMKYHVYRFQWSQPTRGGTVWQLQMPANRDQLLSWQSTVHFNGFSASGQFDAAELIRYMITKPQRRQPDKTQSSYRCRVMYIRTQALLQSIPVQYVLATSQVGELAIFKCVQHHTEMPRLENMTMNTCSTFQVRKHIIFNQWYRSYATTN